MKTDLRLQYHNEISESASIYARLDALRVINSAFTYEIMDSLVRATRKWKGGE